MITVKIGDRVKAFHPMKFGVIDHGTVVRRGSKFVKIDFGELNGGKFKVRYKDVVEVVSE